MTKVTTAITAVVAILSKILVVVRSCTSSGRSRDTSSTPLPNTSSSSSSFGSSWKYDVFLSFRGEDTRKTFVDHLYSALVERTICIYKDDETLPRGDTIGPALLKAIQESHIALIIFSKNYADSSWCLDELAYIMKCKEQRGQIVIPVFYDVDPSDVRKQKGQFGKAFSKHRSAKKDIVESWKKALVDASNISGWEPKLVANGHEAKCIKEIVGSVLDKLSISDSVVDNENIVGMGTRLQDLKSQLKIGSGGVLMVGIWGVGGGGKTTLATSLFMEISGIFDGCCFLENIREESSQYGLRSLQEKLLMAVFNKKIDVRNVDEGKQTIKRMLCHRNVLIVLDDVDDLEQLEALAGSHDWFGGGSRIIITTRDEHLLTTHRVHEVCAVSLLSHNEAIRLFKRYAYHENNPVEDYDKLSNRVITYVNGLPLALKILGSFLYGKDKNEWISALDKLKDIPNRKVMDQLKISYDGLEDDEKELFLDIACFFRRKSKDKAMEILDACGFHLDIGIKVLTQKAFITISSDGRFDMHDLVQEMGHHIVRGKHPNNPEKHSRLWRPEEIEDISLRNATKENDKIEAIEYIDFHPSPSFITLISNLKKLRFLDVTAISGKGYDDGISFLSDELKYIKWYGYPASPFPESFQPRKLVVLKICYTLQKELWKGYKYLPFLKELELTASNALVRTPDFGGLPSLQKLTLSNCHNLEDIDPSLGNHTSIVYVWLRNCDKLRRFPPIVRMEKLELLQISNCEAFLEFPKIEANMKSLVNLDIKEVGIEVLPSLGRRSCTNLISLKLEDCSELQRVEGNFHALKHLQKFEVVGFTQLEQLPKDLFNEICCLEELIFDLKYYSELNNLRPSPPQLPRFLKKLNLSGFRLKDGEIPSEIGELSNLQELRLCRNSFSRLDFSLSQLNRLKLLDLSDCYNLVELPELSSSIAILKADHCDSLEFIGDEIYRSCKWLCQVSVISYRVKRGSSLVGGDRLVETIKRGSSLVGGDRLVETMLQGKAQCMSLDLKGVEIPRSFTPWLVKGSRYRLQLPENWFNEHSGFLFCSVMNEYFYPSVIKITMRHKEEQQLQSGGFIWEEEEEEEEEQQQQLLLQSDRKFQTWVGYVSFGSLRHTAWWDQTSTSVDIVDICSDFGFVASLIPKNQSGQMELTTTTAEICDDDYKCKFKISNDSRSLLECLFEPLEFSKPPPTDSYPSVTIHKRTPKSLTSGNTSTRATRPALP